MSLVLHWGDVSGLNRLANAMEKLDGPQKRLVLQRAVNHTGAKALTQVTRALAKQTGLTNKVIRKTLKAGKARGTSVRGDGEIVSYTDASFAYSINARGGDISLKYFKPRETKAGVTAAPFGKRELFAGAFMRGGKFPNRVAASRLNGHVWKRLGKSRNPLELLNSGVVLPAEMLTGASAAAFTKVVNDDLPKRVMHEIGYLVPGFFD
jgi:hypothetical protein